jgi:hypothetical protein
MGSQLQALIGWCPDTHNTHTLLDRGFDLYIRGFLKKAYEELLMLRKGVAILKMFF